jgi:hypothetical protein
MKWSHLPVAGGIYDQHPTLIAGFFYIFQERNAYEAEKQKEQAREQRAKSVNRGRRPAKR